MSDADRILVRILAHADAVRLPVRDWSGNSNANRYLSAEMPGLPFRMQAKTQGDRKAGERQLEDLAEAGLLTIARGERVKFPLVALTDAGDARARALAGLPNRKIARLFLAEIVEKSRACIESQDGTRWCAEIHLNGGRGWGLDAAVEDRKMLATIELEFCAAAAAGWARAHSSLAGHVAYAATPAGIEELQRRPRRMPAKLPKGDPECERLYRAEADLKLAELVTAKMDAREIGPLPLIPGLLLMTQADLDRIDQGLPDEDEADEADGC